MYGCVIKKITDLCDHVPVEAVEHRLSMLMLTGERRPERGTDGAVDRPGVLPDQELEFSLAALLQERLDLLEGFERGFFACE